MYSRKGAMAQCKVMHTTHSISDNKLTLQDLAAVIAGKFTIQLSEASKKKIVHCREYLDQKLESTKNPIYGINTGFGSLYNRHISHDQLEKLQENLVKSHACGTGPEVPDEIVRLMLFLKVQSLSYGYSGVQLITVERLVEMFNRNVLPRIFEMGSLGASGDLAPLAHLCLPLIGAGEVRVEGKLFSSAEINKKFSWDNIQLQAKDGL